MLWKINVNNTTLHITFILVKRSQKLIILLFIWSPSSQPDAQIPVISHEVGNHCVMWDCLHAEPHWCQWEVEPQPGINSTPYEGLTWSKFLVISHISFQEFILLNRSRVTDLELNHPYILLHKNFAVTAPADVPAHHAVSYSQIIDIFNENRAAQLSLNLASRPYKSWNPLSIVTPSVLR